MNAITPWIRNRRSPLHRYIAIVAIACLIAGLLPLASAQAEAGAAVLPEGTNVLANGSFDSVTNDLPSSWNKWVASGTPVFTVDNAVYKEGSKSLRIEASAAARSSLNQSVSIEAGKTYNFSVWVKMDNIVSADKGIVLRYQFYNASNQKVGVDNYTASRKGTSDWGQITQRVVVPDGAVRVLYELFIWNATGTVWFDDAKVTKEVIVTDLINAQHPRLLATAADFAALQSRIATDTRLARWAAVIQTKADKLLTEPASQYEIPDGLRLLETSRKVLDRTYTLAMQYRLTLDSRYAERAWTELSAAGNFPDWNPRHFLDTAEMTHAFAIGYDWLYDYWTAERKTFLRDAIVNKGFTPALAGYNRPDFWVTTTNNWNFVVNGGIGMGALALGDEPAVKQTAEDLLQRGFASLPNALPQWAPDGGWYEGPGYWSYSIQYIGVYFKALQTALGTDFGLSASPGLPLNGDFPIFTTGPTNQTFNFADAGAGVPNSPSLHWFGSQYGKPEYGWWQTQRVDENPSPLDLLWYVPNSYAGPRAEQVALDKYFRGVEAVTFRSGWEDPNALFVGFKGTSLQKNHHNLDVGTFVLDALGVRWAQELGADNYNLPGYFGAQRWDYYRMRGEGQNVLVINPGLGPEQSDAPEIKMSRVESSPQEALAITDMTAAYAKDATKAERGVKLLDNRRMMLVQDEVTAIASSEYWWFMHTSTEVDEISPDGSTAILTKNGKRLWARILSPSQAKFSVMDAVPLPTSPNPAGQNPTTGIRKLAIHIEDVQNLRLAVLLVPLREGEAPPASLPAVEPLALWQVAPANPPLLSGIALNGVPLAGFDTGTFTYSHTIPAGSTVPPAVTASSADPNAAVTVQQATSLPGIATIEVTIAGTGSARYLIHFPGPVRAGDAGLSIMGVTASSDDGNVPANTIDDDLTTRWSALGDGEWIQYDLGAPQAIRSVSLAWYNGKTRSASFDIAISTDGTSWTNVYSGSSSGLSDELENYDIGERSARYVQIIGHGNTANLFNSITEARIYDRVASEQNKPPSLKTVSLTADKTAVKISETTQLHLSGTLTTGAPLDTSLADIQYFSANPSVVSVDSSGHVTALGAGTAKVAASVRLNGYLKFAVIEIEAIDPFNAKLLPIKDAYVRDGDYAAINYGKDGTFMVKNSSGGFHRQSFLQFDLGSIAGDLVSAKLTMYGSTNDSGGTNIDNTIHAVADDSWTETGLTWNNKPAYQEALATRNVGSPAWHQFDVTAFIAAQLAGDKIASLAVIQDVTPGLATSFNSKDNSSNKPYLEIKLADRNPPTLTVTGVTYNQSYASSAIPVITATDAESGVKTLTALLNGQPFVSGTPVTALGIHTLSATATDYAGNQAEQTVVFSVYDPAQGPVNAAGWFTDSGTVTGNTYGKIHLVTKLGFGGPGEPKNRLSLHMQDSGLKLELQTVQLLAIDSSAMQVQGIARGSDSADYVVSFALRQQAGNAPLASLTVSRADLAAPIVLTSGRPLTGNVQFR
ncbi:DUF7594 domain-containing protein [Paenibacillus ginsengarvi]|uniref:CBM96 family carbohydrate-binding protein n=1 Tax=Paenibacillus ginsengarvi TaxID=400777 RepID=UPI001315069A|nr:DNRLRE domain-containing protein [Paenibacillus ginsengarvi]